MNSEENVSRCRADCSMTSVCCEQLSRNSLRVKAVEDEEPSALESAIDEELPAANSPVAHAALASIVI